MSPVKERGLIGYDDVVAAAGELPERRLVSHGRIGHDLYWKTLGSDGVLRGERGDFDDLLEVL